MNALIFAAGLGTRLHPLTDTMPKALLPLAGKTLLEYQVDQLRQAGIKNIVINVHHFADDIVRYVREHNDFGCSISFSDEREQLLETGGGLRHARWLLQKAEEPILACNVDILSDISVDSVIASYDSKTLGMLVVSERITSRYLLFDNHGYLRGWTNQQVGQVRPAGLLVSGLRPLAFSGMQVLSPQMFSILEKVADELGDKFSMIDAYLYVLEHGLGSFQAYVPAEYRMMDVGKIEQLEEAEAFARSLHTNRQ